VACVWQTDFKILIAYSSVAHIGLVVACISSLSQGSLRARITIILAHGVRSTILFNLRGVLYSISSTRQLLLNWGMLNLWPLFSIFWFLGNIRNIGTPPRINFWGEMLARVNLILYRMFSLTPLAVILFLRVGYSLVLYGSIQSGQSLQSVSKYKLRNINSIRFSTQSVLLLVRGRALRHLL
jgi:NADH:ubiquinone oxidoreductase subunit 4 (subunit M)